MSKFELCNAQVRCGGEMYTVILKKNITASEAAVLQQIHGSGCLHDVRHVGFEEREDRDELARIRATYAKDPNNLGIIDDNDDKGSKCPVVKTFGFGLNPNMYHFFIELGIEVKDFEAIKNDPTVIDLNPYPKPVERKPKTEGEAEESEEEEDLEIDPAFEAATKKAQEDAVLFETTPTKGKKK